MGIHLFKPFGYALWL